MLVSLYNSSGSDMISSKARPGTRGRLPQTLNHWLPRVLAFRNWSRIYPILSRSAGPGLLVVGIVGLVWPALGVFFVGDDFYWIQHARFDMATLPGFLWPFAHTNGSGQFRPLTLDLYFWVCGHLFGMDPLGYHLVELLVFIITALVIYRLLANLTTSLPIAFLGAAIWAFSLTHYEGLNWIDAYAETGAILPAALALYALSRGKGRWATFWYVVCLFSNETVSVITAMATAYLFICERPNLSRTLRRSAPLWIVSALYIAARLFIPAVRPIAAGPFALVVNPMIWLDLIRQSFLWSLGYMYAFLDVFLYAEVAWHYRAALIAGIHILSLVLLILGGIVKMIQIGRIEPKAVRLIVLGVAWFLLGLAPVLPFARNFAAYNLSLSLIGIAVMIAGLAMAAGEWSPALCAFVLISYLGLNLLSFYGPGGLDTTDGVTVFALSAHVG